MYVRPNFKTKKALKEAVKAGEEVTIFQPGPFGGNEPTDTHGEWLTQVIEGPHYPEAHGWYAQVKLEGGQVVAVK